MKPGMLSVDEALAFLLEGATPWPGRRRFQRAPRAGACWRKRSTRTLSVPSLDNTSMDGYAVYARGLRLGEARLPVSQRIAAGSMPQPLAPRHGGAHIHRRADPCRAPTRW